MSANLDRQSEIGVQNTDAAFRTAPQTLCSTDDEVDMEDIYRDLNAQLERFVNQGSSWQLNGITECVVHIAHYRPLTPGSSHIKSPPFIAHKLAVVNVKNADNECFRWSVIAALHPAETNRNSVSNYRQYRDELNWTGISFPTPLHQIRTFERNNEI